MYDSYTMDCCDDDKPAPLVDGFAACCGGSGDTAAYDPCTEECCGDEIKTSADGICCTDSGGSEQWTTKTAIESAGFTLETAECCGTVVINTVCMCCQQYCEEGPALFQFETKISKTTGNREYYKCPKVSKVDCRRNRQLEGGKRKGRRGATRRKLDVASGNDALGLSIDIDCNDYSS